MVQNICDCQVACQEKVKLSLENIGICEKREYLNYVSILFGNENEVKLGVFVCCLFPIRGSIKISNSCYVSDKSRQYFDIDLPCGCAVACWNIQKSFIKSHICLSCYIIDL